MLHSNIALVTYFHALVKSCTRSGLKGRLLSKEKFPTQRRFSHCKNLHIKTYPFIRIWMCSDVARCEITTYILWKAYNMAFWWQGNSTTTSKQQPTRSYSKLKRAYFSPFFLSEGYIFELWIFWILQVRNWKNNNGVCFREFCCLLSGLNFFSFFFSPFCIYLIDFSKWLLGQ